MGNLTQGWSHPGPGLGGGGVLWFCQRQLFCPGGAEPDPLESSPGRALSRGSFEETPPHPPALAHHGGQWLRSCYWKQLLSVGGPLMPLFQILPLDSPSPWRWGLAPNCPPPPLASCLATVGEVSRGPAALSSPYRGNGVYGPPEAPLWLPILLTSRAPLCGMGVG